MILAGKHFWQEVLISDVSFLRAPHQGALILAYPKIGGKFNHLGKVGSARFLHL